MQATQHMGWWTTERVWACTMASGRTETKGSAGRVWCVRGEWMPGKGKQHFTPADLSISSGSA